MSLLAGVLRLGDQFPAVAQVLSTLPVQVYVVCARLLSDSKKMAMSVLSDRRNLFMRVDLFNCVFLTLINGMHPPLIQSKLKVNPI